MENNTLFKKVEEALVKDSEENLSAKTVLLRSLCSTCNNSTSCYYHLRNGKRIVRFCELFDDYEPSPKDVGLSLLDESLIKPKVVTENEVKLSGLCMNCENRDTCTYPKPEGGVWHCEEYS